MDTPSETVHAPRIAIIDTETYIYETDLAGALPYGPKIVAAGILGLHDSYVHTWHHENERKFLHDHILARLIEYDVIAGHNLKYDLHTLFRASPVLKEILHDTKYTLWDTMLVEYILSGQKTTYISLEDLAIQYGIPFTKDAGITESFKMGIGAERIAWHHLEPYLKGDIQVTRDIMCKQMERVHAQGMMPLVTAMMGAYKAAVYMEEQGMYLNRDNVHAWHVSLKRQVEAATDRWDAGLHHYILTLPGVAPPPDIPELADFKLRKNGATSSTSLIKALVYGGEYKFEFPITIGTWKSGAKVGQPRYSTKEVVVNFPPCSSYIDTLDGTSVDETTIQNLLPHIKHPNLYMCLDHVLKVRNYAKAIGYLEGWTTYADEKSIVHTDYGLCTTPTGRWTSSSPNFQNIPNKESFPGIKGCYTTRAAGNVLVEIDFKQLEVIGAALQTGDATMYNHIVEGKDIHEETSRLVYSSPTVTKEQRRLVKTVNFGLIYGGGVTRISKDSGLSRVLVTNIKTALHTLYPGLALFRLRVNTELMKNAVPADGGATPALMSYWVDPRTKRRYSFTQYPSKFKAGEWEFSYTEMCNYPIQGLATGDIVPTVVGLLDGYLVENDIPAVLINTVHDSVLLEVKPHFNETHRQQLASFFNNLNERLNRVFNPENTFDLPLKVEAVLYPRAWGGHGIDITEWLYYNPRNVSLFTIVIEETASPF